MDGNLELFKDQLLDHFAFLFAIDRLFLALGS